MKKKNPTIAGLILVTMIIIAVGISGSVFAEDALTGDEVLEKVDRQQEVITQGDLVSILTFETEHPDGTSSSYKFGSLAKKEPGEPNHTLIYYLEPDDVRGSIFLSTETSEGESQMWLLLSALPQPKKLPASQQQSSFAGSTLTFQEIGDRNMSERYNARIVEETELQIAGESISAYLMDVEAKEGVEARYPRGRIWVGKGNWIILKSEDYNRDGNMERVMEVEELAVFEDKTVMKKLTARNIIEDSATTITFDDRHRPEEEIPNSVFDPDNLTDFDPVKWGIVPEEESSDQ